MILFNMAKDKTGGNVLIFIPTEHVAVFTPEDNVSLAVQLDPECPATFRWVWCLGKQASCLFCHVLGHLFLIIKALLVFHVFIIAAPQSWLLPSGLWKIWVVQPRVRKDAYAAGSASFAAGETGSLVH